MGRYLDLDRLVKFGIWQDIDYGTDLLGNPIKERGYVPATFANIDDYCNKKGYSQQDVIDAICKFGSADLLKQALEATHDIDAYAKAWLKSYKGSTEDAYTFLESVGASAGQIFELKATEELNNKPLEPSKMDINIFNSEEDFVKFYLLGDKKRLWRFIKASKVVAKPNESLIAKSFATKGIDIKLYTNLFEQIQNPKIFVDVCWGVVEKPKDISNVDKGWDNYNIDNDALFKCIELLTTYYTKFEEYVLMDDFLAVVFNWVKKVKFSKRQLKQYDGKSINEMLGERLYNLYKAVFDSKYPIIKKINFALFNGFRGKGNYVTLDTKALVKLSDLEGEGYIHLLAKQYLTYLGRQNGITSKNKDTFAAFGYIDYDDIKRLNNGWLRNFSCNFKTVAIQACFDLIKQGYLQEFVKFMYVNGSSYLEAYKASYINQSISVEKLGGIQAKYMQTESYKNLPVPFEYLWQKEISNLRAVKYPFFILARNAEKQPGFVPEILGEQIFYEEGFNGRLFADKNKQYKQNFVDSEMFSDLPQYPDLTQLYKACALTEKEKQRRDYYAKYFGEKIYDAQLVYNNLDDNQKAEDFVKSVQMVENDSENAWQDNPELVDAEQKVYDELDAEQLEAPDVELDEFGDEIEQEWYYEDMVTDVNWSDDQDYSTLERSIENDWQEFKSLLTGKPKKQVTFFACGKEYDENNRIIGQNEDYNQDADNYKANREAKSGEELKKEKSELQFANKIIAARNFLINYYMGVYGDTPEEVEESLNHDDKTIIKWAKNRMQKEEYTDEALEEAENNLKQDIKNYVQEESTCFGIIDDLQKQDLQTELAKINEQIKLDIKNGTYKKLDEYLQELMGEPEYWYNLKTTEEGLEFLRGQYQANHLNWGLPIDENKDEDSPDNSNDDIPF